ncbi:MAG: DUF3800 domain-containing protein [Ferruginibacter sp.]
MHLLYIDESGTTKDPKQIFFVLAGVSIYENQGYWISNELDKIAARFNPADPNSVELHGSPMLKGKGMWRTFPVAERVQAMKDALSVLTCSHIGNRLFACIIRKSTISPQDPVYVAFEQVSSRFDYYLNRLYNRGNPQRGLMIFDKSTYETTIQSLTTDFRKIGHSWNIIKNFAEVPLFIDSRASRLTQLADLIAYSFFQNYEHGDSQFSSIIIKRLDTAGGIIHGLCERIR